jgi:hypothetical protein
MIHLKKKKKKKKKRKKEEKKEDEDLASYTPLRNLYLTFVLYLEIPSAPICLTVSSTLEDNQIL